MVPEARIVAAPPTDHGSVRVRSGSRKTSGKRPNSCELGYRERHCCGLLPAIREFDGAVPNR